MVGSFCPYSCPGFTKLSYTVSLTANEDFGVLRLGEKALDSHLPNSLHAAFKSLKRQLEHGQSIAEDDNPTRPEDPRDNCSEGDLLERHLFSAAPPTAHPLCSERPPQGTHAAYGGDDWHSRLARSYELTQHVPPDPRQGAGLPVVAEVLLQTNGSTHGSVSYV